MSHINNLLVLLIFSVGTSFPVKDNDADDCSDTILDISYLGDRIFKRPDTRTGKKLEEWNETSGVNPEELGSYAEGDIVVPEALKRNGLVNPVDRWAKGVIPYEIKGSFSAKSLGVIQNAMDVYKKYTCVIFRPRTPRDKDYVVISSNKTGCWSSIGRWGGENELNLQDPSCTSKLGTPMHELMHTIGFFHEHNRHDRDDYIRVHHENIEADGKTEFTKKPKETADLFGLDYDYLSIMHYSRYAFSKNSKPTLMPKDKKYIDMIGHRSGLSKSDIKKINLMYKCPKKTKQMASRIGTIPERRMRNNSENETSSDIPDVDPELFGVFAR